MKGNVAVLQEGVFIMLHFQSSETPKISFPETFCSLLNVIDIFLAVLGLYFAAIICALLILQPAFDSTDQIPLQIVLPSAREDTIDILAF